MRMQRYLLVVIVALAAIVGSSSTAWAQRNGDIAPTAFDFGNRHVGSAVPTTTFDVTNSANENPSSNTLLVTGITEAGTGCGEVSAAPTMFNVVGMAAPQVVTVSYAPTTRTAVTCTMTLVDNDEDGEVNTFLATGQGTSGEMVTSPASLGFLDTNVGSMRTLDVTITNMGASNEALSWSALVTSGNTDFSVSPASGSIPIGGMATVTVTFAPTTNNARVGNLRITGDDFFNSQDNIPLSGTGLAPNMVVSWTGSPGALDFGSVLVAGVAQSTRTINVANTGNANLVFSASLTAGSPDFEYTSVTGVTVAPGNNTNLTVTFEPDSGFTRSGTVRVTATGQPMVDVDLTGVGLIRILDRTPANIPFGNIKISQQSTTSNVTLTNDGNTQLSVSRLQLDNANFQFVSNGCSGQDCMPGSPYTINGGGVASQVFGIRCIPGLPSGSYSATLSVTSNADSGPSTVGLTCTGTAPDISNPTPSSLAFGNVEISQTSDLTFSFMNTAGGAGAETLDYSITMPTGYTVPAPGCTSGCTLAAGGTRVVTVRFTPTLRQAYPGTITINSADDPDEASKTVMVTGQGTAPVIGNPMPATRAHAFANTDVGTTSAAVTISIQNTGDAQLDITSAVLTGGQANQFRISSGTSAAQSVAASGSTSWMVVCEPTSFNAKATTFRISSDGFLTPTYDFTLTCTGEQAVFTFSPPAGLNFGQVPVGMNATMPVTITNSGNQPGSIGPIMSGNAAFTFATVGGPVVAPATSMTVNVTFTPANGNVINTNLTVMTDGPPTSSPASFNVPLSGDGTTMGIDVSVLTEPSLTVALGDLRVGATATRTVRVGNEGDTPFTLSAPTSSSARCTFAVFNPSLPQVIVGGGQATFNVNVTPNALGAGSCSLMVQSSLPSTDTITVSWNGVAPGIELLNPANGLPLDFTGVDVDAAPQTIGVQVRNSGTDVLRISGCALSGSPRFTVQPCSNLDVAVGATTTVDVTFDPTVEALESATLTLSVDAFMVPTVQVMVEGVGVDQNIDLPALAYTFPDTFRNPDEPTVVEVIVRNPVNEVTGEGAPLTLSMVTSNADPVFEVQTPGPLTVDPGGEVRVPVAFSPTSYTPFSGTITIMNDTTGLGMAEVTVTGQGISRYVMVGPGQCDLGVTGVGVPITLSELAESNCPGGIAITNIDPDGASYTIRELSLLEGGAPSAAPFELVGAAAGAELAAGATLTYDVVFTPTVAEDFEVELAVFLDGDPVDHARVTLRGRAVDVDVHGGGCQAGGGGATGWLAMVMMGLGAVVVRRRRRRAVVAAGAVTTLALIASTTAAQADSTRNIEVSTFSPTPATEVDGFEVESPRVGVAGAWALGVSVTHATNLVVVGTDDPEFAAMTDVPLSARTAFELGFAYALAGRFELGLRLPFYQQSGSDPQFSGLTRADGMAFGDAIAHGKAALVSTDSVGLAVSLDISAPTATEGQFAGSDGPTGQLRAIAGWRSNRLALTANGGFLGRSAGELGNISQGSALTFGAGASFRTLEALWVIGEAFGQSGMGSPSPGGVRNLEGVLGVRYELAASVGISAGVGRGLLNGVGSPDLRGFFLFDVSPLARKPAPLVIERPRPPRDTRDDDGDGIANVDDACPADAEDPDGYDDQDGCPDPDNDGDGLLDGVDQCPLEAEDLDGTADDDGCIDPDDDGDGILDVDDKCPKEPEDFDGYMDSDGCDEPDNDGDGIPDVIDQCALEPETINGKADDDGCPDSGESLVMVMPDRIEIFEPVAFTGQTATLTKKSANVLGQVAATMRANRDFKRLRVTVHVHPRGGGDQELSDRRAKVVRDWLVQWGIEPERIDARGMGSTRTLVPKTQKGAAAVNDRVEFIILEKDVK